MCGQGEDLAREEGYPCPPPAERVAALLARRGYLDVGFAKSKSLFQEGSDDAVEAGIRRLQLRYGLPPTGKMDAALVAFLEEPYCDVPDPVGPATMLSGGVPWASPQVTYQYMTWPDGFAQGTVRQALRTAFETWEAVCAIRFTEVFAKGDMRIVFGSGQHGDGWPFDGTGRILAHAFYPDWPSQLRGDLHIDTAEPWVIDPAAPPAQRDLVTTAIHEVGHAIGVPHSNVPPSVMWPNYVGPRRQLHESDVALVQRLYPV
jgi:hypothetical protein